MKPRIELFGVYFKDTNLMTEIQGCIAWDSLSNWTLFLQNTIDGSNVVVNMTEDSDYYKAI